MLWIDPKFICHRLSISSGFRPVAQRGRKLGEEKRRAAREENKKLLTAGFIREIQYPTWLANVVMVKNAYGKWHICIDYTDLNKACPKDPYPVPSIDRLVDGASSSTLLSFMDAYSDARAYCYKVIPFGLKNAGATYQRMMDQMFEGMIGADVEVYMDDMVVKSTSAVNHYKALGRVFQILRKHQLKLNPKNAPSGCRWENF
ncbi:hypothetical protein CR513_27096, partial [Mucuna pruriens]